MFSLRSGLKETTEQLVKKKMETKDKLTPWEEFLEKKKDKKKKKKAQKKQVRSLLLLTYLLTVNVVTI